MGFHDVFDDGKPQAGASQFPRAGFIDPIEALEDPTQILLRDADAGISDGDGDPGTILCR